MHNFHLPDMTCGHCASMVSVALRLVDPACEIQVDLPGQRVSVRSGEDREALVEALAEAGYPTL
jgi:copper chaperone